MSNELETAAALSAGGFFSRKKAEILPIGTPCPNCGTPLAGPWCHVCGQLGEDFHRSSIKLLIESVRDLVDVDGRIWQTLPDLILHPGRLTRRYLDGHRAPQVPPLRFFLVALLLLFLVGINGTPPTFQAAPLPLSDAEAYKRVESDKSIPESDRRQILAELDAAKKGGAFAQTTPMERWWIDRVNAALKHQREFWQQVQSWAERFAVLMLPISALLLGILFVFQRRFYFFDHVIFSMHSLSFLCLLFALVFALERYSGFHAGSWILLAAPLHLFSHMRGVYATSILGTLVRMALLFIGSIVGFVMLVMGLLSVALVTM
jgi:hypothetical protein